MDAVLGTAHGLRRAQTLWEACERLSEGTGDIALAIIDLDFNGQGAGLLKILGECELAFPILVVTNEIGVLYRDESISAIAVDYLIKPIDVTELKQKIRELCRESEMTHEEHHLHLRSRKATSRARLGLAA